MGMNTSVKMENINMSLLPFIYIFLAYWRSKVKILDLLYFKFSLVFLTISSFYSTIHIKRNITQ